jgi:hypothetical protein
MVGCSASTPTQSAADRAASRQQRYEAHPDFWRNRLVAEAEVVHIGPIPIGERRVTLNSRAVTTFVTLSTGLTRLGTINYEHSQTLNTWDGGFYELVDSDTGKVILPLDYWQIVPVPGIGVYVRTPDERIKANAARQAGTAQSPWRKLDLATGNMPMTDVSLDNNGYPRAPDPVRQVTVIVRADPGSTASRPRMRVEVYPVYKAGTQPVTQPLVYGRVLERRYHKLFIGEGKYSVLAGVDEQDRPLTLLLDEQLRYVLETDKPIRKFSAESLTKMTSAGGHAVVSFLAMPAPGTDPADDLWILLDENGRFGAPADVVGYRPFDKKWKPDDGTGDTFTPAGGWVDRWLVRKRTIFTNPITSHPKGGQTFNSRWTLVQGDFTPVRPSPKMWDVQLVRVPWIDRRQDNTTAYINEYTDGDQYDRVFMACAQGETWSIVDPFGTAKDNGLFTKVFAQVPSPADVVPKLTAMHQHEVAYRAKVQKAREQYAAKKTAEALQKRRDWINESWDRCLQSGNYSWCESVADQRGGNSWYEIASAMKNPSVEFLNRVIARTTSEDLKQKLQGMVAAAEQRDAQEIAAYWAWDKEQERRRWLAAHPPDPASYSSYSSGGGSGGSSIGGGMTAGWKVSDDQKRAYMKALGTSPYNAKMGWSNPYAY